MACHRRIVFAFILTLSAARAGGATLVLGADEYLDKLEGGWAGQMIGVAWAASTEFDYQGAIIPDAAVPTWTSLMINDAFAQDDIYVELPFMEAMNDEGVTCDWVTFGERFKVTTFQLWHANRIARENLQAGMIAPATGHYENNLHCDDIDWQIEADFIGQMCPGMPRTATEIAWRAGHVMNYGDGVYGGVFVAAMHAEAFRAATLDEIIEAGRQSVPVGSEFREVIEDVIVWHAANPSDWTATWQLLQDNWGTDDRCPAGAGVAFNIDAKLNCAYILIGLLYGDGDFVESMRIAMRCGQDSDCNPSSVGGILGNWLGYSNLPVAYTSGLDRADTFTTTSYTFDDCIELSRVLAQEIVELRGGTVDALTWSVPEEAAASPILEQWPDSANEKPVLTAEVVSQDECTFQFSASATDADGIVGYQWFFGDLSFTDTNASADVTHTYAEEGTYEVICYVTDAIGNTEWKSFPVAICGRLRLWLPLDELISDVTPDASGCGNDGSVVGATTDDGRIGGALSFDGIDDGISLGSPASLNFPGQITVAAWVFPDAVTSEAVVVGKASDGVSSPWWLSLTGEQAARFGHFEGSQMGVDAAAPAVLVGGWHHLAGTYDGTAYRIYIDGSLAGSSVTSSDVTTGTGDVSVGCIDEASPKYFDGLIDEIVVLNEALSATDIASLASLTRAADLDGDGLPDAWELLYFGDVSVEPADDNDGDGLDNLGEYEHGLDPTVVNLPDEWRDEVPSDDSTSGCSVAPAMARGGMVWLAAMLVSCAAIWRRRRGVGTSR